MASSWSDDDARSSASPGGDLPPLPPEWAALVVPDDARALEADAEAVRAERRAAAQRAEHGAAAPPPRWRRLLETRRWHRYGLSGPVVVLALLVVAAFASLVVTVLPSAPRAVRQAPLATTTAPPGRAGGLVPDLLLPAPGGGELSLREVRPGVVLLVPDACGCDHLVADLVVATRDARLQVLVVGRTSPPALPDTAPRTRVSATLDQGRLAAALAPAAGATSETAAPTALLVRADGVIARVVPELRDVTEIRPDLAVVGPG